ncbi:MAG: hypothetical protein ACREKB_00935 [Candidatus Rokuibacteriota bacterium]
MLQGYVAGRVKAERVVEAVAAAYYGDGGRGTRDGLRPIMEVAERAHPGVVELAGTPDRPGFAVRLVERPFPREYEGELRKAVEVVLAGAAKDAQTRPSSSVPRPRLLSRLYTAVRRLFTAST